MEEWEQLLDGYPEAPDLKCFIKTLKTADVVLKRNLATFESEWIISTLFFKPVKLLETVSSKLNDTSWTKPIGDAFKCIGEIVEKYTPDHLYENIVTLCMLPYPPLTRKSAVWCLARVARLSPEAARDAERLIAELEDAAAAKAPLAALVGVIFEHHPEVVADSANRVWRIYLNLLDSNKNTDTVINAVLEGLLGLFKHFGVELPVLEFKDLYEKISKDYLLRDRCRKACLSILELHSALFLELVSRDPGLRQRLWGLTASDALRAVYRSVAYGVTKEEMKKIADTELLPRTSSRNAQTRHTALRILRQLAIEHGVGCEVIDNTDAIGLELQVRRGRVSLDVADAIQWCIESVCPYSDRLLKTAVLFYNNIPETKRRDVVVYGLLNAPEDVRTTTTTLLITESCQDQLEKYLPLWKALFDSRGGSDVTVLKRSRLVFNDVIECACVLLQAAIEGGSETAPLASVLSLTAHVVTLHPVEGHSSRSCGRLLQALVGCGVSCGVSAAALCCAAAAHRHCGGRIKHLCDMVRIDKCGDEALLCESCHLLVYAPEGDVTDTNVLLTAVEILLTRRDVEPKILSLALQRLESLMNSHYGLYARRLDHILSLVEQLRLTKDAADKEARVLHRDVVLFMGKYGNNNYISDKLEENTIISQLKDILILNLPNPVEGATYKLNLQTILQLAILREDPEALQKLLSVVCATLTSNPDSNRQQLQSSLRLSLTLLVRSLCRVHSRASVHAGCVQQAVLLCNYGPCLHALIKYISEEKSPGVRRMLSDALEGLLLKDPGSEVTEQLVKVAAEHAAVMMASGDPTIRSGGLNITETVLSSLKDNHLLQRKELPNLLSLILETGDLDSKNTFKTAYKMLLENLEIYSQEILDEIPGKLTRNLLKYPQYISDTIDGIMFKEKLKITLNFFKELPNFDSEKVLKECKMIDSNFELKVHLLATCGWTVNDTILEEVLVKIANLMCVSDAFLVEGVLMFLEVHAKGLFEKRREMTLKALENIISNLTPDVVLTLSQPFKNCVSAYIEFEQNCFRKYYQNWYRKFNMQNIIENITKDNIEIDNSKKLKALNIYLETLEIPSYICDDLLLNICDVALDIYVENEKYTDIYKEYISNMLTLCLRYKSHNELRVFLLKCFDKVGLEFLIFFMEEFSEFLLRKPYILLENDMKSMCVILNDVAKRFMKKKYTNQDCILLLEFVDTLWPLYETQASLADKRALLVLLSRLPLKLGVDGAAGRWTLELVGGGDSTLVAALPGGKGCSSAYASYASRLPARLCELSGAQHSALQALLDACAQSADEALLNMLMKLSDCDQTAGWWDEAMASCMAAIGRRGGAPVTTVHTPGGVRLEERQVDGMRIANNLYEYPSLGVCKRLLIPLLRYSTPAFCEQFYAGIINGLLATLLRWVRGDNNAELRNILREHAKAFALITLALEKIPLTSLKSPDSLLYSEVTPKQPSYLMRRASSICVALRKKMLAEAATGELKECYRQSLVENYKCLCTAVCVSRPAAQFYDLLFDVTAWEGVVDCDVTPELPLRAQWAQQKTVHTVADLSPGAPGRAGGTGGTSTRTRMFLRTLSENPLQFDLMDNDEEPQDNSQELELIVNELNNQDGAETLTALLRHAASLAHTQWRDRVAQALMGGCHRNVKWTLAQMICNCKEELKPHSPTLGPALVQMVAETPKEVEGRKLINNLHVDVLETTLYWSSMDPPPVHTNHTSSAIEYIINTTIDNGHHADMLLSLLGRLLLETTLYWSSTDPPPVHTNHTSSAIEYVINTAIDNGHHADMLLSLLGRLLGVYGSSVTVPWRCFENFLTVPDKFRILLRILLLLTKHKVFIPELLPALSKLDEKLWTQDIKLPELFGHSLACGREIDRPLAQYRHFLDRKRQSDVGEYVKLLYYAQLGYPKVCDEFHFKKILDLTLKVRDQSKCLHIATAYASRSDAAGLECLDLAALVPRAPGAGLRAAAGLRGRARRAAVGMLAQYSAHSDVTLRRGAMELMLAAFEDLFGPTQGEPLPKRPRSTSKLLASLTSPDPYCSQVLESVALATTDSDAGVARAARGRLAKCLSADVKIRLSEVFLLTISVPATLANNARSLSVCASAYLDLLLGELRTNERFKKETLRDHPLEMSEQAVMTSKLMTKTRTYQGTFLSSMGKRPRTKQDPVFTGIDVQIPIDDILGTLIAFAKDKPDVSQALCVEITKCIIAESPGFESESLARAACDALVCGDVCPLVIEIGRLVMGDLRRLPDFDSTLDKLRQDTRCTEGESLVQLLYEEARLQADMDIFELGLTFDDTLNMEVDYMTPSLEDLTSSFGKLSNWDRLTDQQKKEVELNGLPQLWVPEDTFRMWLDDYQVTNTKSWFNKLVSACRDECKQDSLRWLRETDRWPRRHFDLSVVTEAIERQDWTDSDVKTCDIRPADCLVEWAARLMIRRAFIGSNDSESSDITPHSRQSELRWCRAANERGLPQLALNCVDVNAGSSDISEALSWRIEKATAMRSIALPSRDVDMLGEALSILQTNDSQFEECSGSELIAMNTLILTLHQDLGSISEENVQNIIEQANRYTKNMVLSKNNKDTLCSLYELAINHYDNVWTDDPAKQNALISSMASVLGLMADLDRPYRAEMLLATVFNRLDEVTGTLGEDAARKLLETINPLIQYLDETSLEQLARHSRLFPGSVLRSRVAVAAVLSPGDERQALRRQLGLVCDARHALLRRCHALGECVDDPKSWSKAFSLMMESIFENPYAADSTEYAVLGKYKNELHHIEDYESTDAKQKSTVLTKIVHELRKKASNRETLRLSQLCPALAKHSYSGSERDSCMSRLLRLGGLGVVKFNEQVKVFVDAVTKPVVIEVLLTDGSTRRYIHKTGDRLGLDAAAQRVARAAGRLWGAGGHSYQVTSLSEDSGLIEYVENTTRLRELIQTKFDLSEVDIGARAEDEELILSSSSLDHHRTFCRQVPANALRSAIQTNCASTEDFINKKQMFLETLSSVTIFSWLFGLGDRHLQNLLYCAGDGGLRCVDWSALFQYGARELPPARLTRNTLAVCDKQVLEARLQGRLRALRDSHQPFLNVIKVSFKWMGEEFFTKFPYIQQYVRGRATSRDVTVHSVLASHRRYKERLARLVADTFEDLEEKEHYSVGEQITCLLRQCTDPKILSVTRSGWEPWV